ncbi:efflux RND transporter periplasmic adaptor subunit [Sulfurimonas sp. SAG-AH-194-I05]|nr:efflux RND transporter periplasmic adaptor subunit [Sulfurimonas sp. SAG-AH-194-I05]MDF1874976.1 efflux RND transporter periplasmic adaptor subunit [Sulfurimonas sp. SAG-AH-194-I05]
MKFLLVVTFLVSVGFSQVIKVSKQQQVDLGIKTQNITLMKSILNGPYTGRVVMNKKDIISISSNVEAVVDDIFVSELEHVKKGQKLLTLKSNALLNLQQEYIEANLEDTNAKQNYKRNKKLHVEGIISKKKLLLSQKLQKSTSVRVRLSANKLFSNGFTPKMLQTLKRTNTPFPKITIFAPKAGVVHTVNVNIGSYVVGEDKMVEIYGDGKRFIAITIPVKDLDTIHVGDVSSFANYKATVSAIGNIVHVSSQSVLVKALIIDAKNIMINRVYEVSIATSVANVYKIKKTALVYDGNKAIVFKKVVSGFEVIDVEIIKEGQNCYIVKALLTGGDILAARATSALLSAKENEGE